MTRAPFSSSEIELMREAVDSAIIAMLAGCSNGSKQNVKLSEEECAHTKAEIEKIVRKAVCNELDDKVIKAIKKSDDVEQVIVAITAKALAKFFELMFTRRSTWQGQLKSMV